MAQASRIAPAAAAIVFRELPVGHGSPVSGMPGESDVSADTPSSLRGVHRDGPGVNSPICHCPCQKSAHSRSRGPASSKRSPGVFRPPKGRVAGGRRDAKAPEPSSTTTVCVGKSLGLEVRRINRRASIWATRRGSDVSAGPARDHVSLPQSAGSTAAALDAIAPGARFLPRLNPRPRNIPAAVPLAPPSPPDRLLTATPHWPSLHPRTPSPLYCAAAQTSPQTPFLLCLADASASRIRLM